MLQPNWLGSNVPHRIRCAAGHISTPRPTHVNEGNGACRYCAGQVWDAFYVVASTSAVKLGITSGDPAPRLNVHKRSGFVDVIRLARDLPGEIAPEAEKAVLAALRLARETPLRGREYYGTSALFLILDVADGYLQDYAMTAE